MTDLDKTIQAYLSGQKKLQFLDRPQWKGYPTKISWDNVKKLIEPSLSSLKLCASFDDVTQEVEDILKQNQMDFPGQAKSIIGISAQIAYNSDDMVIDDSCYTLASKDSMLFSIIQDTGIDAIKKLDSVSDSFKGMNPIDKIGFMISYPGFVKNASK